MENNSFLFICAIAYAISILLIYLIIKGAIKSATESQRERARILYRAKMLELINEGYTPQDISDLHNFSDDEFWNYLLERHKALSTS